MAVRKDSAVHVSLSSDSPVKQPGNLAAASPQQAEACRRADEAGPPTTSRRSVPHVSEELQARHRAVSGRRAVWPGYMSGTRPLSTTKNLNFGTAKFFAIAAIKRTLTKSPWCEANRCAALEPHSSAVLAQLDGTAGEPFQASLLIRAVTGPSLTGPWTARHRVVRGFGLAEAETGGAVSIAKRRFHQ
jgi:hypothetical protein